MLDGVDLALESGGVFGLLGPNGAGKTTTVRILTGVLRPDRAGCVRVLGHDLPDQIAEVRPHIGVQTDTALVRAAHRAGQPHLLRPALRDGPAGRCAGGGRPPGAVRSRGPAGRSCGDVLQGDEAEDPDRPRPDRRSTDRVPRRADGRSRPGGGPRADDLHPRPVPRAGPDVLHHLAPARGDGIGLHEGGRARRRTGRGPGSPRRGRADPRARGAGPSHHRTRHGPRPARDRRTRRESSG